MKLRRRDDQKPRVPAVMGERSTDPPHKPIMWQLGVAVRKYPVQATLAVAMLVLGIPVWQLISKSTELSSAQHELKGATVELQGVLKDTQQSRKSVARAFCKAINANAVYANRQTDQLGLIITNSVRQSKAFERFYVSNGLPPYRVRLKQAEKIVQDLGKRKIPPLDCEGYVKRIETDAAKIPNPTTGNGARK